MSCACIGPIAEDEGKQPPRSAYSPSAHVRGGTTVGQPLVPAAIAIRVDGHATGVICPAEHEWPGGQGEQAAMDVAPPWSRYLYIEV